MYFFTLKSFYTSTHINYDIQCVIIGQKDTDTAAVLHGFVVMEVQFVHLRVAETGQASSPAIGPSEDPPPPPTRPASAVARYRRTYGLSGPSSADKTGHGDPSCSQPLWRHIIENKGLDVSTV